MSSTPPISLNSISDLYSNLSDSDTLSDLTRKLGLDPNADFEGANLRSIVLAKEDLRGFSFRGADLRESSLRGAVLNRGALEGANLDRADVAGIIWHGEPMHVTVKMDTEIPGSEWTSLRTKKLFFLPDVTEAFRDTSDPISLTELKDTSPKIGEKGESYSIAVVRGACKGEPITARKAHAIATGFNALDGRSTKIIVAAFFLLNDHAALFSATTLETHKLTKAAADIKLKNKTITNIIRGGRMTAHAAKVFLEGMQEAYAKKFAKAAEVPAEVKAFIDCKDLRTYVTSSKRAGFQEIMKDGDDEYLVNAADLLQPPKGWTDFQ